MFPDKRTNKATKRMLTKHNLRPAVLEMNIIVPGLHSTITSVPKLADAGYTTVFSKAGVAIYDDYTTTISASNPPILDAKRCEHTGLWKLPLDNKTKETNGTPPTNEAINVIFDLPRLQVSPSKNHSSRWSGMEIMPHGPSSQLCSSTSTCQILNLKGQRQGIRSTKHNSFYCVS